MNITEKKQRIINEIKNTNDELLINEMYDLLDAENVIENIEADELPEDLKIKLTRAMEDYKQGRYITHKQMKDKLQQWFTR
jgi:type VI protein secretion system component VasF